MRLDVQSVDDTRDVTQDRQEDVDEEVGIATSLKEHTERREDDGKDDLADVAANQCQLWERIARKRAEDAKPELTML